MTYRKPLLAIVTTGSMLLAGSLLAQDQPAPMSAPPPAPTASMPASSPGAVTSSAQMQTPQGQLTVKSTVPPVVAGPAPSFEELSGGSRYITADQATAYPLLANDFAFVDKAKTGHITKAEYERWLSTK
ncbi:hypothetical protein ISN76_06915 [Dyella halodurans]|uniref:EF-hand domain-containing protein n=1 Tax=Dyella halodurans TaxID=1920171 RepID=A0ABV9C4A4_9GAMM|nr:hypothetical protein [Dyella halodurans]